MGDGGRRIALALFVLAALSGCGGGGGETVPSPPASGFSTQPSPDATTSQSVPAATGGKITVGSGSAQVTVTIPAHALAADASITVSSFSSNPPAPANVSGNVQLPDGAHFLAGFTVSTGGVALLSPLLVSQALPSGAAASGAAYLAMFGSSNRRYSVVDTATISGSTVTNNNAKNFVGISSAAGSSTPYLFYTSNASPASAPISIVVAGASPGPYGLATSQTFMASAKDANGNPYAFTPSFTLSSTAIGSLQISPTNPLAASVSFGTIQTSGSIQATDSRTGLSGALDISVQSARPATNGNTYNYTGTFTQEFDRLLPSPMPTATSTQSVTQTVTVKGGQTFQGQSNLYDLSSSETDAGALQTVTSQTDTFVGFSASGPPIQYLEYGSTWQDQNGDSLSYVYPTPRILDELPESQGQTWTNSAAASITEDQSVNSTSAAFSSQRVYNADGTYTDKSSYPPGYFGIGSASNYGVIVENSDGSGYYSVPIYGAGDVVFGAPVSGQIPYQVYAEASPSPTSSPLVSGNIGAWYSTPALYSESNIDNGQTAIPASCNASNVFGTNAEQQVQTVNRLDTVLGFTETTTTTTYMVLGYGAVCIQMSDVTTSYYDFQGDSLSLFYSHPYQITKTTETLGLQQSGTTVIQSKSASRSASVSASTAYATIVNSLFARTLDKSRRLHAAAHSTGGNRK